MKKTSCPVCMLVLAVIIAFNAYCYGAEPPPEFLNKNFGLLPDPVADTLVPLSKIVNSFTNAQSKNWIKSSDTEWILKIKSHDLATDSDEHLTLVFQTRNSAEKSLVVLTRLITDKGESPAEVVSAMAEQLASALSNPQATQSVSKAIEPFGGLDWNDGVIETIVKINKMEGIDNFPVYKMGEHGESLRGTTSESEILRVLSPFITVTRLGSPRETFKDKDGTERQVPWRIENLSAEPVAIKGLPFKMTLSFEVCPGLAIANPKAVFQLVAKDDNSLFRNGKKKHLQRPKGDGASVDDADKPKPMTENSNATVTVYCPFALAEVILSCKSPALAERNRQLVELVKEKFKAYRAAAENEYSDQSGYFNVEDDEGSTISTRWDASSFTIKYSRDLHRLEKVYQKHLADLEKEKASKKPDKSNDL